MEIDIVVDVDGNGDGDGDGDGDGFVYHLPKSLTSVANSTAMMLIK